MQDGKNFLIYVGIVFFILVFIYANNLQKKQVSFLYPASSFDYIKFLDSKILLPWPNRSISSHTYY